MINALVISSVLSWLIIVVMGIVIYALARQIGVLHERIKPVGALSLGHAIKTGDQAPQFEVNNLNGSPVFLGESTDKTTLLFFLSSTCPVCKTLLPVLESIQNQQRDSLRIVFASDGDVIEHQTFIAQHRLEKFPYVLSADVGMAYQISKLPYGVLISESGKIIAHGLVNNREHLESLFEVQRLGVATVQEYDIAQSGVK